MKNDIAVTDSERGGQQAGSPPCREVPLFSRLKRSFGLSFDLCGSYLPLHYTEQDL